MPAFAVETKCETNDEGSTFATVTITWADGSTEEQHFARYFDDGPGPSAREQAASYVAAMTETHEYSLEERLGPFGLEWEREQEER